MALLPYLLAPFLLWAQHAGPSGIPVIEAGREAEIQALFSDISTGDTQGWRVRDIHIPYDRIRATFLGSGDREVLLEFRFPAKDQSAVASTPSFEVFVVRIKNTPEAEAIAFARRVAESAGVRDDGKFWQKRASDESAGFWGKIAMVLWLFSFWCVVFLVVLFTVRQRPWKQKESLRALCEMGILFLLAFMVRWLLQDPGPGNLYTRLPIPSASPVDFPLFGPGYGGFMLGWFVLLGSSDTVAFFAGALSGSLTVVPVYILGWLGGGKRLVGLAAGVALALWPIHVSLSPTDDPASLIALLLVSSLALVLAAERTGSATLLVCAWLCGALAATVRPEPALSLLALGALVLWIPGIRRTQLRIPVFIVTAAILTLASLALTATVTKAMLFFSPTSSLTLRSLGKLLFADGGSILLPPRTPLLLGLLAWLGIGVMVLKTKGKAALWYCVGLLPALPTANMANPDLVTARYQLQLVPVAAVFLGFALVWLGGIIIKRLPPYGKFLLPAAAAVPIAFAVIPLINPPEEPTFRLEYAFFRKHIEEIPKGCQILRVRWNVDLGLGPPIHLSGLLGLGHTWITPSDDLKPEDGCLIYWRPASCRAVSPETRSKKGYRLPDCELIEQTYHLETIAETALPAQTGFCETYEVDPVPVGFYRLRPKPDSPE